MPADVSADALGEPDASGGVYLPLVVRATVAGEVLVASYRLRLSTADSVNHNPLITELLFVAADGSATAIESGVPPTVQAGDRMTLRAALADGSTESYPAALGGGVATEMLLTSWFSSAGRFSHERSDGPEPTTVLELDANLPAAGNSIDLFAVTRDNRGGIDYVHRTLVFGQ